MIVYDMQSELISLPLSIISELLFGCEDLEAISLKSRTFQGPDFRPLKIRAEVGVILRNKDPDGNFFEVFVFDTHAEVWRKREWLDSNSRRQQMKDASQVMTKEAMRREELTADILRVLLDKFKMPCTEDGTVTLARALARCDKRDVHDKFGTWDLYEAHHRP